MGGGSFYLHFKNEFLTLPIKLSPSKLHKGMVESSNNQIAMFIICMYQIVEIMRFCKVGKKLNSTLLNSIFNLIKSEEKMCEIKTI